MKKSELKSGMTCVDVCGREWRVLLSSDTGDILSLVSNPSTSAILHVFSEDLHCNTAPTYDIASVSCHRGSLLWSRHDIAITIDGVSYSISDLRSLIKK